MTHFISRCTAVVFAVLLCAALAPPQLRAMGDTLSLARMLAMARAQNPALAAMHARTRAAEARIRSAEAWPEPRVSFEFFQIPVAKPNPFTENMEYDYSIEQMIHWPGKLRLMGEMERAGVRMAQENTAMTALELEAAVRGAHAMLWGAERRREILAETRALAEQIAEGVRARYAVARASQSDALRAQTEIEKLASDAAAIEAEVRGARAMLNALVGRDISSPIMLTDMPDTTMSATDAATSPTDRADLRAMRAEIEMRRTEQAAMRRELYPDFMLRGMYKQMLMGMPDYYALMIGVTIPVAPWSRGRVDGRIEEAEARARAGEEMLADMRRMNEARVHELRAQTEALRERSARMRDALIPQADQAFESSLASYRSAGSDFTAVLDSYRMLTMYRMDLAMLTADYATALARLRLAEGREDGR